MRASHVPGRHSAWPTQGEQVDVNHDNVYLTQATERFLTCDDVAWGRHYS
ncbi:MAG: hypothetical protein K0R61_2851 [Microvirga sp.]|nr:hypothetical protein [Microvirga sp.]